MTPSVNLQDTHLCYSPQSDTFIIQKYLFLNLEDMMPLDTIQYVI